MTRPGLLASVVVAVNSDPRIRRLINSLTAQTIPKSAYEVIVVENGSTQFAGIDMAAGLVRYLHRDRANLPAARNAGLAAARGRYLLLTDADCVAHPKWIETMTTRLADRSVVAAGGTIRKYHPRTWTQRHAITIVDGQHQLSYLPALHLPYVAGANAGFVTEVLRQVGGFDESLHSGNDVDVCYQLGLRGHRVGLAPDAVIWHDDRADVVAHFRRFHRYALYQVLLFGKYKQSSGKHVVLDTYPFRRVATALISAPRALAGLACGDTGLAARALLQIVEAAGVLCGEIEGSMRFRQMYL